MRRSGGVGGGRVVALRQRTSAAHVTGLFAAKAEHPPTVRRPVAKGDALQTELLALDALLRPKELAVLEADDGPIFLCLIIFLFRHSGHHLSLSLVGLFQVQAKPVKANSPCCW